MLPCSTLWVISRLLVPCSTLWVISRLLCPAASCGCSAGYRALQQPLTELWLCPPGGAGPRGSRPPLVAQRGVLPDHGPPRAAAGAGLCIDVRVQILLHHPGRSDVGSTSGSISPSSQATFERGAAGLCCPALW